MDLEVEAREIPLFQVDILDRVIGGGEEILKLLFLSPNVPNS